jgi:hypothetical protein
MLKSSMPQRTKVADIELSRPLADIDDLRGYLALRGVVPLHGTPLGYVRAPIIGRRCTASAIGQAIEEQLSRRIGRHLVGGLLSSALPSKGNGWRLADLLEVAHPEYGGLLRPAWVA